jgi:ribonuclease HII
MHKQRPSYDYEYLFIEQGFTLIAGVDEAGRAPLAGLVSAGAVILDTSAVHSWLGEVRDSKLLSARMRCKLESIIQREAIAWGVGMVSHSEIDSFGMPGLPGSP